MLNPYKKLSKINPQRENGHRRIATDVYIALIGARLSGGELGIVMFIIHKTWGFQKMSDVIAYSQITKALKLTKKSVIDSIKKLEKKRILIVRRKIIRGRLPTNEYFFNKHYDTWLNQTGIVEYTSLDIAQIQKTVKLTP